LKARISAPVAIVVAIALAVSWKPLVKSKLMPAATTSPTMMSPADMGVSERAGALTM
jgi:hypothetical protein